MSVKQDLYIERAPEFSFTPEITHPLSHLEVLDEGFCIQHNHMQVNCMRVCTHRREKRKKRKKRGNTWLSASGLGQAS